MFAGDAMAVDLDLPQWSEQSSDGWTQCVELVLGSGAVSGKKEEIVGVTGEILIGFHFDVETGGLDYPTPTSKETSSRSPDPVSTRCGSHYFDEIAARITRFPHTLFQL